MFRYDPALLARYPSVVGGVMLAEGVTNGPAPAELAEAYRAEQRRVRQRLGETPLSQVPSLAAWRSAFRGFGVEPTQVRNAAEALLRRLTKQGEIPGINALVDLGNLISIRYALPVAVFDARVPAPPITVRFADGSERYTPLGGGEVEHPPPGEVVFADTNGLVIARRWCWRQSEESAARSDTTAVLVTVEAQHAGGRDDVAAALDDLTALLAVVAPARLRWDLLDAARPALDA